MAEIASSQKGSRLTLYIIIGLIAGIALGFFLNGSYVNTENVRLAQVEDSLQLMKKEIATAADTTTAFYHGLMAEKDRLAKAKNAVLEARNTKLDPFSILADIFL